MAWRIEFTLDAKREIDELDRQNARRIEKYLRDRVAPLDDPRSIGKPLRSPRFGEFWRYRVGDHRVICRIRDEALIVLVVRLGHRKDIYS